MGPRSFLKKGLQYYAIVGYLATIKYVQSMAIKNLLLDFGGVLININQKLTEEAFINLQYNPSLVSNDLFDNYERGLLSTPSFLGQLKQAFPDEVSLADIHQAWNELLLDFPLERLEYVQTLAKDYNLFLLSNTNDMHITAIQQQMGNDYNTFEKTFNKIYYSYQMGMRKPDAEIYHKVLDEQKLNPQETMFVDDSETNILAAAELGIHTWHLNIPAGDSIFSLGKVLSAHH